MWRRILAQALVVAPGLLLMVEGVSQNSSVSEVFFGGLLTVGGVLIGRHGVVSQVLGRGAAWALLGPCLLAITASLATGHGLPALGWLAPVAVTAAALALARPMLETAEAKAAFAPLAYRRTLLLASSAAVAYSIGMGTVAVELAGSSGHDLPALAQHVGVPLLAGSLLASAIGVARMRAWGVLLGACTSVLAVVLGVTARDGALGTVLASAALPGAMLVGAILAARARAPSPSSDAGARMRIATEPESPVRTVSLRIAADDEAGIEEPASPRVRGRIRA